MSIDFLKFSFSNGSSAVTVREAQDIKARAGVHAWLYDKAPVMIYSPFMSAPERLLLRIVFSRIYILKFPSGDPQYVTGRGGHARTLGSTRLPSRLG